MLPLVEAFLAMLDLVSKRDREELSPNLGVDDMNEGLGRVMGRVKVVLRVGALTFVPPRGVRSQPSRLLDCDANAAEDMPGPLVEIFLCASPMDVETGL